MAERERETETERERQREREDAAIVCTAYIIYGLFSNGSNGGEGRNALIETQIN